MHRTISSVHVPTTAAHTVVVPLQPTPYTWTHTCGSDVEDACATRGGGGDDEPILHRKWAGFQSAAGAAARPSDPAAFTGASRSEMCLLVQTEGAGRGIFATRDLHEGETILTDQPVVAHPAPASRGTVCYHCLRPRAPAAEDGVEAQGTGGARTEWFCSSACHNQAAVRFSSQSYLEGVPRVPRVCVL